MGKVHEVLVITVFGVDNSSSSYSDNCKNNSLVLGEGSTFGSNGSFDTAEEKLSINFNK